MKLLIVSLFTLFAMTAGAEVRTVDFTKHVINEEGPLKVRLVVKDVVTDGCNHYGLWGDFRRVQIPEGTSTAEIDYLADFGIMHTEMACGEDVIPGLVTLESSWLEVEDARWLSIYAPKGWILEIAR